MSELLDRVTAAIQKVGIESVGNVSYRDYAEAAILAMREPTANMAELAASQCTAPWFTPQSARECWQAMIDEGMRKLTVHGRARS